MSERLTRERWLEEGLAVLSTEGPEGLAAERMAKRLSVTRGSFYWHFATAAEFEGAVLGAWEERWAKRVVAVAAADGRPPRERLHRLISQTGGQDANIYAAAKRLARKHVALADQMKRIDDARIGLVAAILQSGGIPEANALLRARIIYSWAMGHMIISQDAAAVPSETADALTQLGFS